MKNLSISKKLIVGFGIVLILLLITGIGALDNVNQINAQVVLYEEYTVPNAEHIRVMQVSMRGVLHELSESIMQNDPTKAREALDTAAAYGKTATDELAKYKANQNNTDADADIKRFEEMLTNAADVRSQINTLVSDGSTENKAQAQLLYLNEYKPQIDEAIATLEDLSTMATKQAALQESAATAIVNHSLSQIIILLVASLLITILVIIFIRRSILTPVNEIVGAFEEMSSGNMRAQITYESRDELGKMAALIQKTNVMQAEILENAIGNLTKISQGDLQFRIDMHYPGDFGSLKTAIESTVSSLNDTMQTINSAAEQVSSGSAQVSSGAQALASGSTEQASSVEQLNASIMQIAEEAAQNLTNVKAATTSVKQSDADVNVGNNYMNNLTQAMQEISTSSNRIADITKVIEDIAFQTNILALNAAIEAARAGTAGKGFAVVADEVRSLAAKSAEAARQTGELISDSVDTVAKGAELTAQTAQILREIGVSAQNASASFIQIEQASIGQATAIEQIKQGLSQVSAVIQTNAATAEENSATSEEMAAQAAMLHEQVTKFKLRSVARPEIPEFTATAPHKSFKPQTLFLETESELGKY